MSTTASITTKHTPTPWKAVEHNWSTIGIYAEDERCGGTVAVLDIQAEATEDTQAELETWMAANADFIVRACNSHEQLVAALKEARRAIGDHHAPNDCYATGPLTGNEYRDLVECPACSAIAMYDAAISAAGAA